MRKLAAGIALVLMTSAGLVAGTTEALAVGGGVFSVKCTFSHSAQVDPIVAPGPAPTTLSDHQHDFFAARTTNSDSTIETMRVGGTTCPLSTDTGGYWVPSLYKGGQKINPRHMFIYYRSPSDTTVSAFPADLRMIAGGDTRVPPDPTRSQLSLSWACNDSGPFYAQPPNCGSNKLKAHIHFPNCWTGQLDSFGRPDSPDHRSHLAYSKGKTCPSTHPVMLPRLSLHVTYDTTNGTGATLASDHDGLFPGGTQLHADFWNTWDQFTLQLLVDRCLNAGKDCKQMTDANRVSRLGA